MIRMKIILLPLAALTVLAQTPADPAAPPVTEVKAYLSLTDAQLTQLQQIGRDRAEAARSILTQIRDKRTSLAAALGATSPDPAAVGRIMVDIKNLETQVRQLAVKYHNQALTVLTADQKAKVKVLQDAANLAPAIRQAAGLNLLDPPERPAAPGPGGAGMRRMMRMRGIPPNR